MICRDLIIPPNPDTVETFIDELTQQLEAEQLTRGQCIATREA
jgi:hypothetical protein